MKLNLIRNITFLVGAFAAHTALASSVVVPSSIAAVEGATTGTFTAGQGLTGQQLLKSADMPGLIIGDKIIGIRLRLNGGGAAYPASDLTWTKFDVRMGVGDAALGTTFANNFNPDATSTLVRSGSLAMDSATPVFFPGTGAPRAWSELISFTTQYTYTGGNLLIETRTITPAGVNLVIDTADNTQTTGESTFAGASDTATVSNSGILLRNWAINLEVIHVPEPSAMITSLLGAVLAVGSLGFRRLRTKK